MDVVTNDIAKFIGSIGLRFEIFIRNILVECRTAGSDAKLNALSGTKDGIQAFLLPFRQISESLRRAV